MLTYLNTFVKAVRPAVSSVVRNPGTYLALNKGAELGKKAKEIASLNPKSTTTKVILKGLLKCAPPQVEVAGRCVCLVVAGCLFATTGNTCAAAFALDLVIDIL